jgi:hypothetical protein
VDAGLRIEVGNAINRLSAFEISESEFLVVLAHTKTIWKSEIHKDGSSKPVDTGEHYDAFVTNKNEVIAQLDVQSWASLIHVLVNLNDVKNDVDRELQIGNYR